jgi:plastocyanin
MKRMLIPLAMLLLVAMIIVGALAKVNVVSAQVPAAAQTYTIMVGGEDTSVGAEYIGFFASNVHVHTGDTVTWKQNSHEIHTVSFLGNMAQPPDLMVPIPNAPAGAMAINGQVALPAGPKDGNYDGTSYANSGLMGMDPGQAQQFSLTFTQPGTYNYVCLVHPGMKATITVESSDSNAPAAAPIPSPEDVATQGQKEMSALAAQVPDAIKAANADVIPAVKNAEGTTTHYVMMGYNQGAIDLTAFFPSNLTVAPGDKVIYQLGLHNVAPHTATFLNGQAEPDLVVPQPQPSGPPLLAINPAIAAPQNAATPLTAQGIYNTGFLDPSSPGPQSFAYQVGNTTGQLAFECLLHDSNGMKGTLTISK